MGFIDIDQRVGTPGSSDQQRVESFQKRLPPKRICFIQQLPGFFPGKA
jgi:hypothetical protein